MQKSRDFRDSNHQDINQLIQNEIHEHRLFNRSKIHSNYYSEILPDIYSVDENVALGHHESMNIIKRCDIFIVKTNDLRFVSLFDVIFIEI